MTRTSKLVLASVLGLGILGTGVGLTAAETSNLANNLATTTPPTTRPHEERHPEIRKALVGLREAKRALEHADHDFDGHRKAALEMTDKAIKECEDCLKTDKK